MFRVLEFDWAQHRRTSCGDGDVNNGLYARNGKTWHQRCRRCMLLEIPKGKHRYDDKTMSDFAPEELER